MLAPTAGQLAWQQLHQGVFFHFGLNTFHGVEWSDGTLPAASFDPDDLDADQWVQTARDAGARYVVLTAKHHDGFCLWPTATTDYAVSTAPWRGGRGDVVAEVAAAAGRAGLSFGLYLSPWDRNARCYSDPVAYDRFYQAQLLELCTRYGELGEIWFDGAGSAGRTYDWDGVMAIIDREQPQAMVFNMGEPTIRWVGNEDGLAADPVRYVSDRADLNNYDPTVTELDAERYLPPECDVSIRRGWFWAEDDRPKSVEHLLGIYYRSVGMGANLLLNLPPDRHGRIPDEDVTRLREWRTELDRRFGRPVEARLDAPETLRAGRRWTARFDRPTTLDHLRLTEDYSQGQRVSAHRVLADGVEIAAGGSVGEQRIHTFEPRRVTQLVIETDGPDPVVTSVTGYDTGGKTAPDLSYLAPTTAPAS